MLRLRELDRPARRPAFVGLQTAAQVNSLLGISPANLWPFNEQGGPGVGTLTVSGAISNNETVTIDAVVYRWRTATLAQANDVLAGASVAIGIVNLVNAINGSTGSGSVYHASTTPHTTVMATAYTATTVVVTARTYGTAGNSLATTETMANGAWGGATLAGGTAPGAAIDVVAAANVTAAGTGVTQDVGCRWPTRGVSFTDAGTGRLAAANTTTFDDDGVTSFAFLTVWRMPTANPAALRYLLSKYPGATPGSWRLNVQAAGGLFWICDDDVDVVSITVAAQTGVGIIPIWCAVNRTNTTSYLAVPGGSDSASIAAVGSMTNAGTFTFGTIGTAAASSPDATILWAARFTGAAAESDGTAHILKMRRCM